MNPELSPSPRETPAVSRAALSSPQLIAGTLPSLPLADGAGLSCFQEAWEGLESPTLANTILERHRILKQEKSHESPLGLGAERVKALVSSVDPFECRERLLEFFRWQATLTPDAPLFLSSKLLHDRAIEERNSLSSISEIAEAVAASGTVPDKIARDALLVAHEDIRARNPLSMAPSLLSVGLATLASQLLHPLLACGSMVAAGFVLRAYRNAAWARQEYTFGYLQEVFDTHQALSRGEVPTIIGSLRGNFDWNRNERFRADGYMIARTLRLLEVPSSEIHEAFATTASVELQNQPLINLLIEKLEGINMQVSGCLAADYLESQRKGGDLARVLDALNACYFTWGKRTARLYQNKMLELLMK